MLSGSLFFLGTFSIKLPADGRMWCNQALCGQSWRLSELCMLSWVTLGALWAVLGCSWTLSGLSWATLGAFVGGLEDLSGPLWAVLGRSGGDLG